LALLFINEKRFQIIFLGGVSISQNITFYANVDSRVDYPNNRF